MFKGLNTGFKMLINNFIIAHQIPESLQRYTFGDPVLKEDFFMYLMLSVF